MESLTRKPIICYHGTNNDIDKFDINKTGKTDNGLLGRGLYFTTDIDEAKSYGKNIYECNVKLNNPIIINNKDDLNKFFSELNSGIAKLLKEKGYDDNTNTVEIKDPDIIKKLEDNKNSIINMGYDGVICDNSVWDEPKNSKQIVSFKDDNIEIIEHYNKSENMNESLLSKETLELNLDKWTPGSILYITGNSGGGKTTLSKEYAKQPNTVLLELDIFFAATKKSREKINEKIDTKFAPNDKFLNKALKDYFNNYVSDDYFTLRSESSKEFNKEAAERVFETALDFIYKFDKKVKQSNKKYIFEGTMIYSGDPEFFVDKPIIILGTGYLTSMIRAVKRAWKNPKNTTHDKLIITFSRIMKAFSKENPLWTQSKGLDDFRDDLMNESETMNESLLSKETLELNMDKWVPGSVLYITGNSGSGKSTLSEKIYSEKPNCELFQLDLFFLVKHRTKEEALDILTNEKEFSGKTKILYKSPVLKKHFIKFIKSLPADHFLGSEDVRRQDSLDFIRYFEPIAKKENKYFIVEGTNIFKDTDYIFYKSKPLIILGTGYITSTIRAIKRAIKNDRYTFKKKMDLVINRLFHNLVKYERSKQVDEFRDAMLAEDFVIPASDIRKYKSVYLDPDKDPKKIRRLTYDIENNVFKVPLYKNEIVNESQYRKVVNLINKANPDNVFLTADIHLTSLNDIKIDEVSSQFNSMTDNSSIILLLGDITDSGDINTDKKILKLFLDKLLCKNVVIVLGNNDIMPMKYYKDLGLLLTTNKLETDDYVFTHIFVNNTRKYNFAGHIHGKLKLFNTTPYKKFDVGWPGVKGIAQNKIYSLSECIKNSNLYDTMAYKVSKNPVSEYTVITENENILNNDIDVYEKLKEIKYDHQDKVRTPEEVEKTKMGDCHDQAGYTISLMNPSYNPRRLFMVEYNPDKDKLGATHTVVYYNKDGKIYWIEHAWDKYAGINGPYNNIKELKDDLSKKWEFSDGYTDIYMNDIDSIPDDCTLGDYVFYAMGGKDGMPDSKLLSGKTPYYVKGEEEQMKNNKELKEDNIVKLTLKPKIVQLSKKSDVFDTELVHKLKINDIIDSIKDIKYGFIDKTNNLPITDREWIHNADSEELNKRYSINYNPISTLDNKLGICLDQSIAIKYLFNKLHPEDKCYIYQLTKGRFGHAVPVFVQDNEYYYLENAWDKERGLHGPFNSREDTEKYLSDVYHKHHDLDNDDEVVVKLYEDPNLLEYDKTIYHRDYWTCPYCGANLDYGEHCDCQDKAKQEKIKKEEEKEEYDRIFKQQQKRFFEEHPELKNPDNLEESETKQKPESLIRSEYSQYVREHINNVRKGYNFIAANVPEMLEGCDKSKIGMLLSRHDASKYSSDEFMPYANFFYGNGRTQEVKDAFHKAWNHHWHVNPHHPEYWNMKDMPKEYIIEMICDWWSFSWKDNKIDEIFDYYHNTDKKKFMSENTKKTLAKCMKQLRDKLRKMNLMK